MSEDGASPSGGDVAFPDYNQAVKMGEADSVRTRMRATVLARAIAGGW